MSGSYLTFFERLVDFASSGPYEEQIQQAREEYFVDSGAVREDEPSFEARMEAFTEWYVLERPHKQRLRTPLEIFLAEQRGELGAEDIEVFEGFRNSQRRLFEFLKVRDDYLITRDLFSASKEAVFERRKIAGVDKHTIFDARVLHYRGKPIFTRSQIYHPLEVRKLILAEVKRLRKHSPDQFGALLDRLSLARLRYDRYRRVDVARLYRQVLEGDATSIQT